MILSMLAAASVATAPLPLSSALWKSKPTIVQLMRAYPEAPRLQRIGGRVEFECEVKADGALDACRMLSETPTGMGFGEAALELSRTMALHPKDRDGADVAGRVIRVPIRWSPPPAPPEGQLVDAKNFTWSRLPTGVDIARVYPAEAQAENVEGRAVAHCKVAMDGRLTGCAVVSEEPYGYGLGEAVLMLSTVFQVERKTKDGPSIPPESVVRLPIRFVLPH